MPKVLFDEGRYLARVTAQQFAKSKNGNPMFTLSFMLLGKVDPADPAGPLLPCNNYERRIFLTFTENTIERAVRDLGAIGFTGTSFRQLDPMVDGGQSFIDQEIEVFCQHKADDRPEKLGELQEKWGIAFVGGAAPKLDPADDKQIRQLDAMFGKHLKPNAKAAAPKKEARAAAAVNDDIPF